MGRGSARWGRSWGAVVLAGCVPAGLVLAGLVLPGVVPSVVSAAVADPAGRVLAGGVTVAGATAPLPDGWRFEHVAEGVYRLRGDDGSIRSFDVTRWDAVAEVTLVPLARSAHEVRFVGADGPVDTAFSFNAVVRP